MVILTDVKSTLPGLVRAKHICLETYRRDGSQVRTPLWFVEVDGILYARTRSDSGKVKRIRRTPRVRLAVCDILGNLNSEWVSATALIDKAVDQERINRLFNEKYGLLKVFTDLFDTISRKKRVVIAVRT